jgi:hypothetical protein
MSIFCFAIHIDDQEERIKAVIEAKSSINIED